MKQIFNLMVNSFFSLWLLLALLDRLILGKWKWEFMVNEHNYFHNEGNLLSIETEIWAWYTIYFLIFFIKIKTYAFHITLKFPLKSKFFKTCDEDFQTLRKKICATWNTFLKVIIKFIRLKSFRALKFSWLENLIPLILPN